MVIYGLYSECTKISLGEIKIRTKKNNSALVILIKNITSAEGEKIWQK